MPFLAQLIAVGKRHCRVLACHSGAAGIDMTYKNLEKWCNLPLFHFFIFVRFPAFSNLVPASAITLELLRTCTLLFSIEQ